MDSESYKSVRGNGSSSDQYKSLLKRYASISKSRPLEEQREYWSSTVGFKPIEITLEKVPDAQLKLISEF